MLARAALLFIVAARMPRRDYWPLLILGAILVLAAVLRLRGLGHESLWHDEVLTWNVARAPLAEFWPTHRRIEVGPPGYFLLANRWMHLFGGAEASLRMPSALAGIASVGAMYLFVRRLLRDVRSATAAGLVAALMLCLSRYHIAYSQEARPYAVLLLLALLCCHAFMVVARGGGPARWEAAYVATGAAMLWVHPYGIFVLAAHGLFYAAIRAWAAWTHQQWEGATWRRALTLTGAVVALYTPFLAQTRVMASTGLAWADKPMLGRVLVEYADTGAVLGVLGVLAAAGVYRGWRKGEAGVGLALLLATLPVIIPVALSQGRFPVFTPRYGIAMLAGLYALAGYGVVAIGRWAGTASVVGLAAFVSPALVRDFRDASNLLEKPAHREAVALIESHATAGDAIYGSHFLTPTPVQHYLRRGDLTVLRHLPTNGEGQRPQRVWHLVAGEARQRTDETASGYQVERTWDVQGLQVRELRAAGG